MRAWRRSRPRWPAAALPLGFVLGLALGRPAASEEGPPLLLELCQGHVASAEVVPPASEGAPYTVAVRLMPEAAEAFAELTEDHVGRLLEIRLGPEHAVRATIRQPIRSGLVTAGGYATQAEAEAARDAALASRTRDCRAPEPGPDPSAADGMPARG